MSSFERMFVAPKPEKEVKGLGSARDALFRSLHGFSAEDASAMLCAINATNDWFNPEKRKEQSL